MEGILYHSERQPLIWSGGGGDENTNAQQQRGSSTEKLMPSDNEEKTFDAEIEGTHFGWMMKRLSSTVPIVKIPI